MTTSQALGAAAYRTPGTPDRPPPPHTVADTGLTEEFITDLLLKTLYTQGARTGQQLVDVVRLPFDFVDHRLLDLQQRRLCEVRGTTGHSRAGYIFDLTSDGRDRARAALEASQYVGAAPVPLAQYGLWTMRQSIQHVKVTRQDVEAGFQQMVLDPKVYEVIGPAMNSARSLFLYGGPGNGKTFISETIAGMLGGGLYIPYAVEVDGQILLLYDPVHHHEIPEEGLEGDGGWIKETEPYDRRFVRSAASGCLRAISSTAGSCRWKSGLTSSRCTPAPNSPCRSTAC